MANKLSIALEQGAALAHFDKIAANSSASAAELLSTFDKDTDWKLEDIVPIAPKLLPTESIDKNFQKQMHVEEPQATRFLFVGRIYSNKNRRPSKVLRNTLSWNQQLNSFNWLSIR